MPRKTVLSEAQVVAVTIALEIAAETYGDHAAMIRRSMESEVVRERLAEQFDRQRAEAERLQILVAGSDEIAITGDAA